MSASTEALLGPGSPEAPIARRDGVAISRRQYLADAAALAERLPAAGAMLNLSLDRYRFAVGLGAAVLRGQACLLPPNHTPHTVERLRARFAGTYALVERAGEGDGLPEIVHAAAPAPKTSAPSNPQLAADRVAAHVLTSGSTGDPLPHAKPWGLLAASARSARRGPYRDAGTTRATPSRSARAALSAWSCANGTPSIGRPARSAWPSVPTPHWRAVAAARGRRSECGAASKLSNRVGSKAAARGLTFPSMT